MKITSLRAENVKRLTAVAITPEGHIVTVGGKNGAGKSSVLDSIAYALGGKDLIPDQPIRKGQTSARASVELDDLIVTRTFKVDGESTLVVTTKTGAKYPSPQAMLDKLVGRLTFDPLAFARQDQAVQADTLRRLVGCDTSDLETRRREAYDHRTIVNREIKILEGQIAGLTRHDAAPAEEISIATLSEEITRADDLRQAAEKLDDDGRRREEQLHTLRDTRQVNVESIARLRAQIAALEQENADLDGQITRGEDQLQSARAAAEVAAANVPDVSAIRQKLVDAERLNGQVRANRRHDEVKQQLEAKRARSTELTTAIDSVERDKQARLQALKFPVDGLGLDDAGVTFHGLPFDQASTAEQLRVSVAVGLALNPTLKVLLVRDGSLLDTQSLQMLAEMAEAADAQIWIEKVAESKDGVSVLIEDGAVAGAPVVEPSAAADAGGLFDQPTELPAAAATAGPPRRKR